MLGHDWYSHHHFSSLPLSFLSLLSLPLSLPLPLPLSLSSPLLLSQDAKTGLTTSAIQDKIIEITTLLVARRGKLNAEDDNGMTPEDIARKFKFTDLAQIMAELKGR